MAEKMVLINQYPNNIYIYQCIKCFEIIFSMDENPPVCPECLKNKFLVDTSLGLIDQQLAFRIGKMLDTKNNA